MQFLYWKIKLLHYYDVSNLNSFTIWLRAWKTELGTIIMTISTVYKGIVKGKIAFAGKTLKIL